MLLPPFIRECQNWREITAIKNKIIHSENGCAK